MTLLDHLKHCAALWSEANSRSTARLSTIVVNDGNFFVRIENGKADTTTGTLEKFARFFADPASWQEGRVPAEAISFVHRVNLSAAEPDTSPDHDHGDIGGALVNVEVARHSPVTGAPPSPGSVPGSRLVAIKHEPGALFAFAHGADEAVLCAECELPPGDPHVAQCNAPRCPRRIAA